MEKLNIYRDGISHAPSFYSPLFLQSPQSSLNKKNLSTIFLQDIFLSQTNSCLEQNLSSNIHNINRQEEILKQKIIASQKEPAKAEEDEHLINEYRYVKGIKELISYIVQCLQKSWAHISKNFG